MAKEVQGNYARVKANIVKSADKMPAEDYSFKPTPDIRTFARVVNHVTEAQMHVCGAIDGVKPDWYTVHPRPPTKPPSSPPSTPPSPSAIRPTPRSLTPI